MTTEDNKTVSYSTPCRNAENAMNFWHLEEQHLKLCLQQGKFTSLKVQWESAMQP